MKEGIHPAYHQATVTCNCGNTFEQVLQTKTFTWKFVQNVIHSIQDSRKQLRLVDVLISLIKNTEWTNKYCMYWGLRLYDLNLF